MTTLILALPMALLFVALSDQWSVGGFVVGYLIGVGVGVLTGVNRVKVDPLRLPVQLFWGVIYAVRLFVDIVLSSIDVAWRVLHPNLPINPGEIPVSTQDENNRVVTSALSAFAITVTPGEMVVGFEDGGDETIMIVHTLDVESSTASAKAEQTKRLTFIRRMLEGQTS